PSSDASDYSRAATASIFLPTQGSASKSKRSLRVDFTVGGADPQDFYQTDAWAGFDPYNGEGRMSCLISVVSVVGTCASPKLDSPVFSITSLVVLPTTIFQIKIRT